MQQEQTELITKSLEGKLSEKEKNTLKELFKNDPDFLKEYNRLKKLWDTSGNLPLVNVDGKKEVWIEIKRRIEADKHKVRKLNRKQFISRVAAVAAIFIVLAGGFFGTNKYYFETNVIETGDVYSPVEWVLPDGSKVYLDRNSRLEYPNHFGWFRRTVKFEGQGYFLVQKNPDKPMIVKTHNSETKVLGTIFNLNSYSNKEQTLVSLLEGIVVFKATQLNKTVEIAPGEMVQYNVQTNDVVKLDKLDKNVTAWKDRKIVFENDKLSYVFNVLSNYYNKDFIIDNQKMNELHYTGTFEKPELETVLKILSFSLNIDYSINDDSIVLTNINDK